MPSSCLRGLRYGLSILALIGSSFGTFAQNTWNGSTDANWSTATNWSGGVPTAGSDVLFPSPIPGTGAAITLTTGSLANSLAFNAAYTLTGGDLTLTAGSGGNVNVAVGVTATINSALIGSAGLTVNPSGTGVLVLGGTNTFTGTVAVNAGTLSFSSNANLGAAANAIALGTTTSTGTLNYTGSSTAVARAISLAVPSSPSATAGSGVVNVSTAGSVLTLSGVISGGTPNSTGTSVTAPLGNVSLAVTGPGTVLLSGTNTFTGNILVDGGNLSFSGDANLGTTAVGAFKSVIIQNGGSAIYTGTGTYNPTDGSGTGTNNKRFLIGTGGGTINVTSATGLLQLDDDSQFGGTGPFTKIGPGTLMLNTKAYNFTPTVNIVEGTLRADTASNTVFGTTAGTLATNNPINISNGATYDVRVTPTAQRTINIASTGGTLANGATTNTVTLPFVNLGGTLTFAGTGNLIVSAIDLGSTNRTIVKTGAGNATVNGTAANAAAVTTTVTVTGGSLLPATSASLGTTLAVIVTGLNSEYLQTDAATTGSTYAFDAGTFAAGSTVFFNSLNATNTTFNATASPAQTQAGGNAAFATNFAFANTASRLFGIAGQMTDTFAVGTGTPYYGIAGDRVNSRGIGGTVTANSDFIIAPQNGLTFYLSNGAPGATPLNVVSSVPGTNRALTLQTADPTAGTTGTIRIDVRPTNFEVSAVTIARGITLDVRGNNAFVGSAPGSPVPTYTFQNGSTFNPSATPLTVNAPMTFQSGSTLQLDDGTTTVGNFTVAGAGLLTMESGSIANLANANTLRGITAAQLVNGPGTIVRLSVDNVVNLDPVFSDGAIYTFTGGTRTQNVAGITLGTADGLSRGALLLADTGTDRQFTAGTATGTGITVGAGGALLGAPAGRTFRFVGLIEGSNNYIQIGSLTAIDGLARTGAVTFGLNTAGNISTLTAGSITVAAGTFQQESTGTNTITLGATGQGLLSVANGATFNSFTATPLNATLDLQLNGFARATGATFNVGGIQGAGNLVLGPSTADATARTISVGSNNASTVYGGVISDNITTALAATLTKVGTGTLTFAGNNTYDGPTTISAGALQLGNNTPSGSVAGTIVNNATLIVNRLDNYTMATAISGTGSLLQNGIGNLTLTGTNSYTGPTAVNTGALTVASAAPLGSTSSLSVAGGARFYFAPAAATTLTVPALTLSDNSTVGVAFGSTVNSTSAATTAGTVKLALTGTPTAGTNTYTLLTAPGGLNSASYVVVNNVNYTYSAPVVSPAGDSVTLSATSATAPTAFFYKGGFAGNTLGLSDGSTLGNFALDINGTNTPLIPGPTALVTYSATGATGQGSQSLGADLAFLGLVVNDTTPVVITDPAYSLTLNGSGIAVNAGASLTVNARLVANTTQTWANNGSGVMTLGSVVLASGVTTVTGSGNTLISGNLAGPAAVLTKTGTGSLSLGGADNRLQTLNLNSAGVFDIGAGDLLLSNGGGNTLQSTITSGTITINATGGGRLVFNVNSTNGPDNGVGNGGTMVINAQVTGGSTFEFFQTGVTTGVIYFANNANDFAGGVVINQGIIRTDTIGNAGFASGLGTGANIYMNNNAATLRYTGTGETTNKVINFYNTTGGGIIEQAGTGALVFTGNFASGGVIASRTLTLTGSTSGTGEIAGVINQNSSTNVTNLVKTGLGTWKLSGANTFTGSVTISAGGLIATNSASLGTGTKTVTIIPTTNPGSIPSLRLDGSAGGFNLPSTLSYTISYDALNTGVPIANQGAIVNVAGNNAIEGNITVTSGGGSAAFNVLAGSLTLNGVIAPGTGSLGYRPLYLRGTGDNAITGVVSNNATTATNTTGFVLDSGTGTWRVTNNNTFSGANTVSTQTLLANNANVVTGSATGTGTVTVSGTGTLGGIGRVAGAVTVNSGGTLRAGDPRVASNVGTLTAGSSVTFTSGSTVGVRVLNVTNAGVPTPFTTMLGQSGTAGTDNNYLVATGAISVPGSGLIVTIDATGTTFDTSGTTAYSYKIAQSATNSITGMTAGTPLTAATFNPVGFTASNYSLNTDGTGGLYVNFTPTAVPEPVTVLGLAAAGLGLAWARRRRTAVR